MKASEVDASENRSSAVWSRQREERAAMLVVMGAVLEQVAKLNPPFIPSYTRK
jgi:hypothetical protein